jgi:hypothetical protein
MMLSFVLKVFLIITIFFNTLAFINVLNIKQVNVKAKLSEEHSCNERIIYKNYLLGLSQLRRTTKSITNTEELISFVNFTNNYISNTSLILNNTEINNKEIGVKKLILANIHIDVSNVKYIHISTKKDVLIVELDKKNKLKNILSEINNVDALINTLTMLLKIMNIT